MDVLWSPWRYDYIKGGNGGDKPECVFCWLISDETRQDATKFILHRGEFNFVVLNIYPYISGHLLIVPFAHVAELDRAEKAVTDELMDLTKFCQTALREVYEPHGFNVGINLGKAAGAGVAAHLHQHIMPRWFGDSNFMATTAETRVIPEDLSQTYSKLLPVFKRAPKF